MNANNFAPTSQQGQEQKPKRALRLNITAKLVNPSELCNGESLVYEYFTHFVGTTLDCCLATGVLRNSITYFVDNLEKQGRLGVVRFAPDRHTGYTAKYYSTRKELWMVYQPQRQLSFNFSEG